MKSILNWKIFCQPWAPLLIYVYFYGEYDNLDDESRRSEAFHRIRQMAEKAQEDAINLIERTEKIV